jgi:hypothetical protein
MPGAVMVPGFDSVRVNKPYKIAWITPTAFEKVGSLCSFPHSRQSLLMWKPVLLKKNASG